MKRNKTASHCRTQQIFETEQLILRRQRCFSNRFGAIGDTAAAPGVIARDHRFCFGRTSAAVHSGCYTLTMSADGKSTDEPPRKRRRGRLALAAELDADLSGACLFYPSSGRDWAVPIELFLPYVSSFWFVDRSYRENVGASLICDLSRRHPLVGEPRAEAIEGTAPYVGTDSRCGTQQPFVKTAWFLRNESQTIFDVHWCGHDGPDAVQRLPEPIGIFFYRGDGDGEGGSSIPWLSEDPGGLRGAPGEIHEVLSRLVDGGLLVTDGGNTFNERGPRSYKELGRFFLKRDEEPATASKEVQAFEDHIGNRFRCIGYLESDGYGKGPTLIWQVRKAEPR